MWFVLSEIHTLLVSGGVGWNIPHLNGLLNKMETPVIPLTVFILCLYLHMTQTPHFIFSFTAVQTLQKLETW